MYTQGGHAAAAAEHAVAATTVVAMQAAAMCHGSQADIHREQRYSLCCNTRVQKHSSVTAGVKRPESRPRSLEATVRHSRRILSKHAGSGWSFTGSSRACC